MDEVHCDNEESPNIFLFLPAELLVYIFSFLPTSRDKARLRYVSQRIRNFSETPSLWTKFVWPHYDNREERLVSAVLKVCGNHIKELCLPDHVAPTKLVFMLRSCRYVTQVNLGSCLYCDQLDKVMNRLLHLQKFEFHCEHYLLKHALPFLVHLQELTIHTKTIDYVWWPNWAASQFKPPKLNLVTKVNTYVVLSVLEQILGQWESLNLQVPAGRTACLKFYNDTKIPLNMVPTLPEYQLLFGKDATLSFAKASKFGILGLTKDLLLLTDHIHNGKIVHKVFLNRFMQLSVNLLMCSIDSLSCVTHFDASNFDQLYSGHLEQLAITCPNLQRLNLSGNHHCLKSLHGLHSITSYRKLQGLNIVHMHDIEDHKYMDSAWILELWELLGHVKLTHLAADLHILLPKMKEHSYLALLVKHLQKCVYLKVLELSSCFLCETPANASAQVLSYFQSLAYFKLDDCEINFPVEEILSSRKELKLLRYCCMNIMSFAPIAVSSQELQQLCIETEYGRITETFMDTVSAHGELTHVILFVRSITAEGIDALVKNSRKLITFHVYMVEPIHGEQGARLNLKVLKANLKERFPHRRLFTASGFKVVQGRTLYQKSNVLRERNTDLQSMW